MTFVARDLRRLLDNFVREGVCPFRPLHDLEFLIWPLNIPWIFLTHSNDCSLRPSIKVIKSPVAASDSNTFSPFLKGEIDFNKKMNNEIFFNIPIFVNILQILIKTVGPASWISLLMHHVCDYSNWNKVWKIKLCQTQE